jgi:hypothetical protein
METKKGDNWNSQTWEDLVLRLLAETIKLVADDQWTMTLGESYSTQIPLYKSNSELKRCSLKHLGLILQKLQHKVGWLVCWCCCVYLWLVFCLFDVVSV